ncbi:MAG: response regulator [Lachnospiraceae bacterium]|nr:response regulator [Lachnospiraceae bacterium]
MHTLLIVEDEKMIRQGIKAMIQRSGVPVDTILECGNGEMALEILKTQVVDVMFTDIRMPKMDGIELVKAMQDLPNKPLTVAVSGYDEFSYAVEMLRAGVREYILKPVDRDKIKEILTTLDEEIKEKHVRNVNTRTIGCQQIKHMIWDDDVTDAEVAAIASEYGDTFFTDGYFVVCLDNRPGDMKVDEDHVYINNLGDFEIYILKAEVLNKYKLQEWRTRYIGISRLHTDFVEIKDAYNEARKARIEAFWLEKLQIDYDELLAFTKFEEKLQAETISSYIQMLGTDKVEQAMKNLRSIFWNARRDIDHFNLDEQLVSFLSELSETYDAVLHAESERIEKFKHLYAFKNIGFYENEFMGWLDKFTESLNHKFEDYKNKQKIQQAVMYVRENYDKDLNMAVVSNHISMNYSLFSYAFKQYTGTNFVAFLKDIRMNKAKELLEKTDMRIVEISQKIGYENEKHFMKIFKASYGVSPTEYRKNMQFKKDIPESVEE